MTTATAKQNASELLSKFDDSKRVVAKLMARENITVQIVDGAPTASFDTVRRVLTIPNWASLTIDQFDHLIGHEVGHALFTDNDYLKSVVQHRSLMSFFNVVEDARIERKMKTAFPGLARVFYNSYKEFHENGPLFKGTKTSLFNPKTGEEVPVKRMNLIDRINLFYKVGAFMSIPFSASERQWLARIDRCGDMETALRIARALRKLAKEEEEKRKAEEAAKTAAPPTPLPEKDDKKKKTTTSESDSETEAPSDKEDKKATKSEPKKKDEEKKEADADAEKKSAKKDAEKEDEEESAENPDAGDDAESEEDGDSDSDNASGDSDSDEESDEDSDGDSEDGDSDGDSEDGDDGDSDGGEDSDEDADDDSGSGGTSDDGESDEESASGSSDDDDDDDDEDGDSGGDTDGDEDEDDSDSDSHSDSTSRSRNGGKGAAASSEDDGWGDDPSDDADSADDPVAETSEDAADKLQELAEDLPNNKYGQLRHVLIGAVPDSVVRARTVTAAEFTKSVTKAMTSCPADVNGNATLDKIETEWNEKYLLTAKAMAAEFDRKKNARAQQRALVSKTGRLDMGKLHQYKFSEDLFKRSVAMPHGQSHGIVMVIDGSGSMSNVFGNVIDQTLLFAHFAFTAKIPFEAYMFTDNVYREDGREVKEPTPPPLTLTVPAGGALVGLVNTNTDRSSFQKQTRSVLALRACFKYEAEFSDFRNWAVGNIPYAYLGGTPLYSALLLCERHVERMKRTLRLDKMMMVTISDGADGSGLRYLDQTFDKTSGTLRTCEEMVHGRPGLIVRDTVTKKNYVLAESTYDSYSKRTNYALKTNAIPTLIFDVMKDRHSATSVYIYLTPSTRRRRRERIQTSYYEAWRAMIRMDAKVTPNTDEIEKELTDNGQYAMPKGSAIADLGLILPTSSTELTEDEFENLDTSNMSQRRIAKEFTEAMTGRISNRKFVNTVIPFIA